MVWIYMLDLAYLVAIPARMDIQAVAGRRGVVSGCAMGWGDFRLE